MSVNRGKQFEYVIQSAFQKVPGVSIDRLHDQTTGYKGSQNICDFIVYKQPNEYYIECKSVHGASLPFRNITDMQWKGLLRKSRIKGVFAGVIVWFVDKDVTLFIPIQILQHYKDVGLKSIRYTIKSSIQISGKKKRVFFDYDMEEFLNELSNVPIG